MCRIAGIINKQGNAQQRLNQVKQMCDLMAYGGPDGEGFFYQQEEGLAFGHRRLALIDLSAAGNQPMQYAQNRFTISFNGEIYNYFVLKNELQQLGFTFNSTSDTEVILAGFAHWGMNLFEKLNGMFAFALFDHEKKTTYLVRDRAGIKPLYYFNENNELIFASEVKVFKDIVKSYNKDWRIYFLAFGHIPEPFTTLNQVFMLPKAHYLVWDHETAKAEIIRYHLENYQPRIFDQQTAVNGVQDALGGAVQRHLIADAPIGVFLSGGIDSSILTLLANKHQNQSGQPLHTVSINFTEDGFSERVYQEAILQQIDAEHAEFKLDKVTFNTHFPEALTAMDQPTADGINSWFINYYAKKKGLKAVLSGIGADELFGGYPSFWRMGLVNFLSKLPSFVFKTGRILNSTVGKRGYYLSYKNNIGKYLFLRGFFAPSEIAKLLDITICEVNDVLKNMPLSAMPDSLTPHEQASWLETNLYMQNQLLKDTDFMSMQHGVEVRIPFLDNEVVQLVNSIADPIKYSSKKKKGLLIDSYIKLLPQKIWDRPKMGFTFPFQNWLKANQHFEAGLSKCTNKKALELIADFKKGKLHWSKAMAIYQVLQHD